MNVMSCFVVGLSKFAKLARSVTKNKSVIAQQTSFDSKSDRPSQLLNVSPMY